MLDNYKAELLRLAERSHEQYDKQISFISSAAIGATMFLVDKLFPGFQTTSAKWLIIAGWCCLALSLLLNLVSHTIAGTLHHRTASEIDNGQYDEHRALRRNRRIAAVNYATTGLLFTGIILIICFVSINLTYGQGTKSATAWLF